MKRRALTVLGVILGITLVPYLVGLLPIVSKETIGILIWMKGIIITGILFIIYQISDAIYFYIKYGK